MRRIVVGIDGSQGSRLALEWAFAEATEHAAAVEAVSACPYPDLVGIPGFRFSVEPLDDATARTRRLLDAVVDDVAGPDPRVEIRRSVRPGSAADQLLAAAADADLLVVGSRGLGGFRGLVLGSVSQQCISHAVCPTVVIPTPTDSAGTAAVDADELENS